MEHGAGFEPARISRQICNLMPSTTWLPVHVIDRAKDAFSSRFLVEKTGADAGP